MVGTTRGTTLTSTETKRLQTGLRTHVNDFAQRFMDMYNGKGVGHGGVAPIPSIGEWDASNAPNVMNLANQWHMWQNVEMKTRMAQAESMSKKHNKPVILHQPDGMAKKFAPGAFASHNVPEQDPDNIVKTTNIVVNNNQRKYTEDQFATNMKEGMKVGAREFPQQDFDGNFEIFVESPAIRTDNLSPDTPIINQGPIGQSFKVEVPATLMPPGVDRNLNFPLAFIKGIQWENVSYPSYKCYVNKGVVYGNIPRMMSMVDAQRFTFFQISTFVYFAGGLDITSLSWYRIEIVSPKLLPLTEVATTDPTYDPALASWYLVMKDVHDAYQTILTVDQNLRHSFRSPVHSQYWGAIPEQPVLTKKQNFAMSTVTNYLVQDTDIPAFKVSKFKAMDIRGMTYNAAGSWLEGEDQAAGANVHARNTVDTIFGPVPQILFHEEYSEVMPASGMDFTRGGTLGIPSVFFPNPTKTQVEVRSLTNPEPQSFYYQIIYFPPVPYACWMMTTPWTDEALPQYDPATTHYTPTDAAAVTLPFNTVFEGPLTGQLHVTGNFMSFNSEAFAKVYSNYVSPSIVAALPKITFDTRFEYPMKIPTAGLYGGFLGSQIPHMYAEGPTPVNTQWGYTIKSDDPTAMSHLKQIRKAHTNKGKTRPSKGHEATTPEISSEELLHEGPENTATNAPTATTTARAGIEFLPTSDRGFPSSDSRALDPDLEHPLDDDVPFDPDEVTDGPLDDLTSQLNITLTNWLKSARQPGPTFGLKQPATSSGFEVIPMSQDYGFKHGATFTFKADSKGMMDPDTALSDLHHKTDTKPYTEDGIHVCTHSHYRGWVSSFMDANLKKLRESIGYPPIPRFA